MERRTPADDRTVKLRAVLVVTLVSGLAFAGCDNPPAGASGTPAPEMKNGHPVIHLPPIESKPFEEGYNAGYEYATKHASPKGKVPTEEEAAEVARQQAAGQPDRWERGFAEGYTDGVRKVVTRQR